MAFIVNSHCGPIVGVFHYLEPTKKTLMLWM